MRRASTGSFSSHTESPSARHPIGDSLHGAGECIKRILTQMPISIRFRMIRPPPVSESLAAQRAGRIVKSNWRLKGRDRGVLGPQVSPRYGPKLPQIRSPARWAGLRNRRPFVLRHGVRAPHSSHLIRYHSGSLTALVCRRFSRCFPTRGSRAYLTGPAVMAETPVFRG